MVNTSEKGTKTKGVSDFTEGRRRLLSPWTPQTYLVPERLAGRIRGLFWACLFQNLTCHPALCKVENFLPGFIIYNKIYTLPSLRLLVYLGVSFWFWKSWVVCSKNGPWRQQNWVWTLSLQLMSHVPPKQPTYTLQDVLFANKKHSHMEGLFESETVIIITQNCLPPNIYSGFISHHPNYSLLSSLLSGEDISHR